jgi:Ca-activated chloride channel family protein
MSLPLNKTLLALMLALMAVAPSARGDTVIVYDASNSMWGQIEGEAKVTIARRVLAGLVRDWEASEPLGLVAYGHRREGDCSDIETVVPVGPIDRERLLAQIESISPRGRTPLTEAVRHAAEALRYRDVPATVILVSDGIESCNADPCALASELAEAGINFTAHVVGFDVGDADQAQLACIAENTGGRFFVASDAAGLQAALDQATEAAVVELLEPAVTLTAPESAVAGSNVEIAWEGESIHPRDLVTLVPVGAAPDARGEYRRVGNENTAQLQAPGRAGPYEARYVASATGLAVASAAIELSAANVIISGPASAAAGANVEVEWTGSIHPRDQITIVPAGAADSAIGDYFRVSGAAAGAVQAPAEPGDYELRYVLESDGRVLARAPIRIVAQAMRVSGPESVVAGGSVSIEWSAAVHPRDKVTIVPVGAPAEAYGDYRRVSNSSAGSLQAPAEPGDYEIRYLLEESGEAVASAPLRVTAAETSVSGPATALAGARIEVRWTRAIHHRDLVTVVPAGAPADATADYRRVSNLESAPLDTPAEPGDYEIRYLLEASGQVIARAPIVLTAPEVTITAPATVAAEERFEVRWSQTVHPRDLVVIVSADAPADADETYRRAGSGNSGMLQAPETPGDYEVRYLLVANGVAIARTSIRVE